MKSKTLLIVAAMMFLGTSVSAATFWWDEPEVVRTVALGVSGQAPAPMVCAAAGRRLFLPLANGNDEATGFVFDVSTLTLRRGGDGKLLATTPAALGFTGGWGAVAFDTRHGWLVSGAFAAQAETQVWQKDASSCDAVYSGGAAFTAGDFSADGTTFYSNETGTGRLQVWTVSGRVPTGLTFTFSQAVASSQVNVLAGLSATAFDGATRLYYGEGAAAGGSVCVFDAATMTETKLCDLAGAAAPVARVRAVRLPAGAAFLNVFCTDGRAFIYALAADGLSLVSTSPLATVDLSTLVPGGTSYASVDVAPDGLSLFVAPATTGANVLVAVRSSKWGLVDAVSPVTLFPWRDDAAQTTPKRSTASSSTVTITSPDCWADPAIYKMVSWNTAKNGGLTSTFSNLAGGDTYRFEWHGSEVAFTAANKRVFNLSLNGVQVMTNLDITAEVGAKASLTKSFSTTANGSGQIVCSFGFNVDNPVFSGLAVWGREAPRNVTFNAAFTENGTSVDFSWNATDALAYYVQSAPAAEGPWTTFFTDQAVKKMTVSIMGSPFYRVVASNGVGSVVSAVKHFSPAKFPVYALNAGWNASRVGRFAPDDHREIGMKSANRNADISSVLGLDRPEHEVPEEVYRSGRWCNGALSYRLPHLDPAKSYDIRLYCIEASFSVVNRRVFRVDINGVVQRSIDVFADTGRRYAVAEYVFSDVHPQDNGVLALDFVSVVENPAICGVEVVENGETTGTPIVPPVHGAFARRDGVQVSIGSTTGDVRYDIRRRQGEDGEWCVLVEGTLRYSWLDAAGTEQSQYSVRAVNEAGVASDWSEPVSVTARGAGPQAFVGMSPQRGVTFPGTRGDYVPYTMYSWSSADVAYYNEAAQGYRSDMVLDPPLGGLYSRIMYAKDITFLVTNLYPNATYRLRIHGVESYYTQAGKRIVNYLTVNDYLTFPAPFDAFREVGKGVFLIERDVTAQQDGKVLIWLRSEKENVDLVALDLTLLEGTSASGAVRSEGRTTGGARTQTEVANFDLFGAMPGQEYVWAAKIRVPEDGTYTFTAEHDGDYVLWIDDAQVFSATNGQAVANSMVLTLGSHLIRARYVPRGTTGVALSWSGAAFETRSLAAGDLVKPTDATGIAPDAWRSIQLGTLQMGDCYKVGTSADGADVWRFTSAGYSYYQAHDEGHFLYQTIPGGRDFEMSMRVRTYNYLQRNSWNLLGLQVRTALAPLEGDFVWASEVQLVTPGMSTCWYVGIGGDDFTDDTRNIAHDYKVNATSEGMMPIWLKVRGYYDESLQSRALAFSYSRDGTAWTEMGVKAIPRERQLYVGVRGSNCGSVDKLFGVDFDHLTLDVAPPEGTFIYLR